MRRTLTIVLITLALASVGSGVALAQTTTTVTAFGGLTLGGSSTLTGSSMQPVFGGNVAFGLTPNIQITAEGGYINDLLPSLVDRLVSALTPVDLRVRAIYGQGGVRLLTDSRAKAAGYLDASAGFARLSTRFSGVSSADPFVNAALSFFDRTSPMLGVGGGVLLGMGPAVVDLGYRYKRILNNNPIDQVLTLGSGSINVNEVRVGVGVRF